jgi:hypothetical protein
LGKICVGKDSGEYFFTIDDKKIEINRETVKIAEPNIKKNISKGNKRLLEIKSGRQIETRMENYTKRIGLSYPVKAMHLRKFGKNHSPDEIVMWLDKLDEWLSDISSKNR